MGAPVLTVKGRKSGKEYKIPLLPIQVDGVGYLLATRGESDWVKNLRASDVAWFKQKGKKTEFRPVEVFGDERAKVVARYQKINKATKTYFDRLPNPDDHPTFKMETA